MYQQDICNYTIRMVDESSAGRGIYKLDVYTSSDAEICIPDNCETLHSVNYSTTGMREKSGIRSCPQSFETDNDLFQLSSWCV